VSDEVSGEEAECVDIFLDLLWKAAKGRLDREVPVATLPAALLARFAGRTGRDRLVACLNFLAPITTTSFG